MTPNKSREKVMVKSIVVNFLLIVFKATGSILFRSSALLSDAVHSFSDFMSDLLVIIGLKQSKKPADADHPIGHGKVEYVLSLFLGIMILFMAYQLISMFITSLGDSPEPPSALALVVVIVVIISKWLLSRVIKKDAHALDSQVLHASADESLGDALSSLFVIIGVTFGVLGDVLGVEWLLYADNIAGLVIALFIIRIAFRILKDAIHSLLGKTAPKKVIESTKQRIATVDGVKGVDGLTMIVYGHYYQVMVDIRVDASITVKKGHDIAHHVKKRLHEDKKIGHVIVHVNPQEV